MHMDERLDRRAAIASGLALGVGLLSGSTGNASAGVDAQGKINPDEGVTAPEDLMKEHGVLNRCLLIYEEGMRRLRDGEEVTPNMFHHTADLVRRFVEEYHEKNEENYIFPVFEKRNTLVDLVHTLKIQHKAGRTVTNRILDLSTPDKFKSPGSREEIRTLCESFIRMYRPHESREDTVLFPALRTLLTPKTGISPW